MFQERLLVLPLFMALTFAAAGSLRAQWISASGPVVPFHIIAASGSNILVTSDSLLLRTTNNGLSWDDVTSAIPVLPDSINTIVAIGTDFLAGTQDGIYRTSDNGTSWQESDNGMPAKSSAYQFVFMGSTVFVGLSYHGYWRSVDNGMTWLQIHDSALFNYNNVLGYAPTSPLAALGDTLFFIQSNAQTYLLRSTDSGMSWHYVTKKLLDHNSTSLYSFGHNLIDLTDQGGYYSSDNGATWHGTGVFGQIVQCGTTLYSPVKGNDPGISHSTDYGETWTAKSYTGTNGTRSFLPNWLAAEDTNLLGTMNDAKIDFGLQNDSTWTDIAPNQRTFGAIAMTSIGNTLITGSNSFPDGNRGSINLSTDRGALWEMPSIGVGTATISSFLRNGNEIFAATEGNGIFLTQDTFRTWTNISNGLLDSNVFDLIQVGSNIFAATDSGIFRSNDDGDHWILASFRDTAVYFITSNGTDLLCNATDKLFLSTDNAQTWTDLQEPGVGSGFGDGVGEIAVLGRTIITGTNDGVGVSTDYGVHWSQPSPLDPGGALEPATAFLKIGSTLLAGSMDPVNAPSTATIFVFNGISWKEGPSVPFPHGDRITAMYALDSDLYVAGDGIVRMPLSTLGITASVTEQPPTGSEVQAYPNPLSRSTTISFTPQTSGYADVSIVNLLCAQVAHLFSGELGAGEHSIVWSKPPGLPDGMYECLVRMNGKVKTLPLVLVR